MQYHWKSINEMYIASPLWSYCHDKRRPVFYLWLSKFWASGSRRYRCNVFAHWLSLCSAVVLSTTLKLYLIHICMETSLNGNISRVAGPLWRYPHTKANDGELWCFFDLRLNKRLSKQSRWRWCHRADCDVTVTAHKKLKMGMTKTRFFYMVYEVEEVFPWKILA